VSWPIARLGDVATAHYGKALKEGERNPAGSYTVFGSSGPVGTHSETLFKDPMIVIGRKGSVGDVTYAPSGGWAIDTTYYLQLHQPDRLDLRYLYWALSHARLGERAITTSIPGLNRDELYRARIPLPPLAEQRRIAAMLDKADAVRRKRRESLKLLDDFLRSAYMAIVGPMATGYEAWPRVRTAELAVGDNAMRTGPFGSALRHSEFVDSGIAVLGIDNAVQNRFSWGERRFITREKYEKFKRYRVKPRDVIVTIMGTTGRSAVVPDDIPLAMSTKHLAVITVDRSRVDPTFLSYAIHSDPTVLSQIAAANRGAIMAGLNLGIIKRLQLRVPPLVRQEAFASVVAHGYGIQGRLRLARGHADRLFDALTQRAFSSMESVTAHPSASGSHE